MLLAERADEINVAPRDAAFAERNRLGEKIELGIGRSQSIDTLARNHCGERVASAFDPQRKVTGRHRVEMRIEHERRERAVTSLDDREQIPRGASSSAAQSSAIARVPSPVTLRLPISRLHHARIDCSMSCGAASARGKGHGAVPCCPALSRLHNGTSRAAPSAWNQLYGSVCVLTSAGGLTCKMNRDGAE